MTVQNKRDSWLIVNPDLFSFFLSIYPNGLDPIEDDIKGNLALSSPIDERFLYGRSTFY